MKAEAYLCGIPLHIASLPLTSDVTCCSTLLKSIAKADPLIHFPLNPVNSCCNSYPLHPPSKIFSNQTSLHPTCD